jgi:hypothetical protein
MKLILTIVLATAINYCIAQNSVNTGGGNTNGTGGSVSYSIGQVFTQSVADTSGKVNQGVQQPIEIFINTGIDNKTIQLVNANVFPNPTQHFLILEINEKNLNTFSFILQDLAGKVIETKTITSDKTELQVAHLKSATYLVNILKGETILKSFKVVKQ